MERLIRSFDNTVLKEACVLSLLIIAIFIFFIFVLPLVPWHFYNWYIITRKVDKDLKEIGSLPYIESLKVQLRPEGTWFVNEINNVKVYFPLEYLDLSKSNSIPYSENPFRSLLIELNLNEAQLYAVLTEFIKFNKSHELFFLKTIVLSYSDGKVNFPLPFWLFWAASPLVVIRNLSIPQRKTNDN